MYDQSSNAGEVNTSAIFRKAYAVPKLAVLSVVSLAILLVAVNALLLLQNRRMKLMLSQPAPAFLPMVGSSVPSLSGFNAGGKREFLTYGSDPRSTVVFVFAQNRRACSLNWPVWTNVAARIDQKRYRLAYVNLGPPVNHDYLQDHQIQNSIVLVEPEPTTIIKYNL